MNDQPMLGLHLEPTSDKRRCDSRTPSRADPGATVRRRALDPSDMIAAMQRPHETPVPHAVDLFCGVGGLTHGLMLEGINVVAGYDIDGTCAYPYETNNAGAQFHQMDIADVTAEQLEAHYPPGSLRILVGCAPCQPYSSLTKKRTTSGVDGDDPGWEPLARFAELISQVKPDIVSMENVTRLANVEKYPVYADFRKTLHDEAYHVTEYKVYGPDYGVPQTRRRLVVFASKHGPLELQPPTHDPSNYVTVNDVLAGLSSLKPGEADPNDAVHTTRKLSEINRQRVAASRVGGTWRDWPEDLQLACHKRESGRSFQAVYGRMDGNAPGPTVTTLFYNPGTGRFVHPHEDRALSLREGALLQTFPRDYKFVRDDEEVHFARLGRHVGNAVPVSLGQAIGASIQEHIRRYTCA